MTEEYWLQSDREDTYLISDVPEEDRDAVLAKIERGLALNKPFHVVVPDKRGGASVISKARGGGAVNNYPDRETAVSATEKLMKDGLWKDAPWIE